MLKSIRLKNCQSWEDTTINLATDRPNVLVANNNVGKSVIFKMLKVTANPQALTRSELNNLIRFGEECAMFVCLFTDDSIGMTIVYPNRVLYRFKLREWDGFNTYSQPPTEYLEHLSFVTSDNLDFIANIIDTDQDLYLVNTKSSGNVELLKLLAEEPVLGDVLHKIDDLLLPLYENDRLLSSQVSSLKGLIDDYSYVDVEYLEREVATAEGLTDSLESLSRLYDDVDKILQYDDLLVNYEQPFVLVRCLELLLDVLQALDKCIVEVCDYDECFALLETVDHLLAIESDVGRIGISSVDYEKYSSVSEVLNRLVELNRHLNSIAVSDVDYDGCIPLIDICVNLNAMWFRFDELLQFNGKVKYLQKSIEESENRLLTSDCIVECPIQGKVIYSDEKCIPYNF